VRQPQPPQVLVASERGDLGDGQLPYNSLRIVDLQAQRVSAVLAGHAGPPPRISRQLCAASQSLVFTMDSRLVAVGGDLILLHAHLFRQAAVSLFEEK
jgi:hypothetical protein